VRPADLPDVSVLIAHQKFLKSQEAAKLLKMDLWVMLHMSVRTLLSTGSSQARAAQKEANNQRNFTLLVSTYYEMNERACKLSVNLGGE
jgi:hypothetical protein